MQEKHVLEAQQILGNLTRLKLVFREMPKVRYPRASIAQRVEADADAVMLLIRRARATNANIEDAIERSLQVIAESQELLKRLSDGQAG